MPQKLTETIQLDRRTKLNHELFIRVLTEVQARLDPLEILRDGLETAIKRYADFVRDRTDLILGPKTIEINALIAELTEATDTAKADLEEGATNALAQIQPQIDEALEDVETALSAIATAITNADAAIAAAVASAGTATTNATNAATAANAAAAGVASAIVASLADTQAQARRQAIAFAVAL
ncbi:hypothetical protein [Shinella sp.]|jgi:hypothetical protein|uniref:hypothetical protein n=1 Tax=Shinella sp. TaxID=1870904 RepID=UPI003F6F4575